jgi:transcriptional regulator with XRE-family HTH domain
MDSLGETIRKLREEKELPLRTVEAFLDIDQAILSKIEIGKLNVMSLLEFLKILNGLFVMQRMIFASCLTKFIEFRNNRHEKIR